MSSPQSHFLISLFPSGFILSRRFILTIIFIHYPQRKRRIQLCSPAAIRDLFSPTKNITFPYIMTHAYTHHTNTISFIFRTSLLDTYHALHTANLYLSGRMQLGSQLWSFYPSQITDQFLNLNRIILSWITYKVLNLDKFLRWITDSS